MTGSEFIQRVQRYAKAHGLACRVDRTRGKGSHVTLYLGTTLTIVRNPKDELKTGTLHAMLKQLGLTLTDLWRDAPMNFVYPVTLAPDPDGGFVVTFPDWPEAITQGETRDQALEEAADCLEEAVAARIDDRAEIALPSPPQAGEATVAVPIATALKAALYVAVREAGIGTSELARRLGVNEKEARRLLDPRHGSKAAALERALLAVGRRLTVEVQAAAKTLMTRRPVGFGDEGTESRPAR